MANTARCAIDGTVAEEEVVFSPSGLCQAAGASPGQVLALVDEGVLQPTGDSPRLWAFAGPSLRTTRAALRLNADRARGTAGTALVLDLMEEFRGLRVRLRRAGLE